MKNSGLLLSALSFVAVAVLTTGCFNSDLADTTGLGRYRDDIKLVVGTDLEFRGYAVFKNGKLTQKLRNRQEADTLVHSANKIKEDFCIVGRGNTLMTLKENQLITLGGGKGATRTETTKAGQRSVVFFSAANGGKRFIVCAKGTSPDAGLVNYSDFKKAFGKLFSLKKG